MMGLCCFILFFFLIHPFHVRRLVSSPPSSSTAPIGLSCCCNVVVVVYHWTFDANLCFALALCPLLVVVHILSVLPSSLSLLSPSAPPPSIVLVWPVTIYFTLFLKIIIFDLPSPSSSPLPLLPLLSLLFFNACDVCIGLFWCDQSSTPKIYAQNQNTHPTQKTCITIGCFLLATTYLALCLLLCVRPPACPALPWLVAASSCPLCDWLCWWRTCSSPKYGLLADRYHFCEKCFNEIQGESVSLGDDPSQPQT